MKDHNPALTLRIFDALVNKDKRLVESFAERHNVIQQCNEEMRNTLESIRTRGWKTHEKIWNSCLFLNTVAYDLSHHVYDLSLDLAMAFLKS